MATTESTTKGHRVIQLSEHDDHGPLPVGALSEIDIDFLQDEVNQGRRRIGVQFDRERQVSLSTSSFVGSIRLPDGPTIQVEPKAAAGNLIPLLLFAADSEVDVFDHPVIVEEGGWFVDAFAAYFLAELDSVLRRGLRPEYVHTESSERFLRGSLNVHRQQQRHPIHPTEFECDYEDLTYDTKLNQAILFATDTLSNLMKSKVLAARLSERAGLLRRRVEMNPITIADVDEIEVTRLNAYYSNLLELVKFILRDSYVEGLSVGGRSAFSFLINMNDLYERVVEQTLHKVCEDQESWSFEPQAKTDNLLDGTPNVRMYPDAILKISNEVELVLDAKWKTRHSNTDIYQLLAYQSAYDTPGMLVYPQSGGLETKYEVQNGRELYRIELPTKAAVTGVNDLAERLTQTLSNSIEAAVNER